MAFDEELAERVRDVLVDRADLTEKRMFGGLTFLLGGNMCCGVHESHLILRLGPERAEQALEAAHVGPMDFTGRPMRGFVTVQPEGLAGDELQRWVELAVQFAQALPPKK
jgi:TfoX/Sxy family transcriptional regulator of competence genes